MDATLAAVLVAALMLIGLAGIVLPFMPGIPILWGAALLYGIVVGFGGLGIAAMVAISVLAVIGIAAGLILPERAGTASGASPGALTFGLILGVFGFFIIPVIGFVVGASVGVLLAQYRDTQNWGRARRSTIAVLKGFGAGLIAELFAGITIVAVWAAWALLDQPAAALG